MNGKHVRKIWRQSTGVLILLLFLAMESGLSLINPELGMEESKPLRIKANLTGNYYAGLAIGIPWEDIGTVENAGGVNVLYSSSTGLSAAGDQFWDQGKPGIPGSPEKLDNYGRALISGDFNGDGHFDLAIGIPYEDIGTVVNAGGVNVLYGSSNGLSTAATQFWDQNKPGIEGIAETGDFYGDVLTSGDFNGDGYTDLAIGIPWEDIGTVENAGGVNVLYGSSSGLSAAGNQYWDQDKPGIPGTPERDEFFGYALTTGDFNGDGYTDLAIGIPKDDVGTVFNAGGVNVLYGSSSGLSAAGNQYWDQDKPGIPGTAESSDLYGRTLISGDFNGDDYADLAIGIPYESIGTVENAGGVNVLYGSASGLSAAGTQFWDQDKPGIPGTAEEADYYGDALASGDFDGDGYADLAIGVPNEDLGTIEDAGGINVLYGSSSGLSAAGTQFWDQDKPGIIGTAEEADYYGDALASGDFDGDGYVDLAIGIPWEDIGAVENAGGVNVLYGSSSGLSAAGNQFWDQNKPGIEGISEKDDLYGRALVAIPQIFCLKNDFNSDGQGDILWRHYGTGANALWYIGASGGSTALGQGNSAILSLDQAPSQAQVYGSVFEAGEMQYKDERVYYDVMEVDVPCDKNGIKVFWDAREAGDVNYMLGEGGIKGDMQELMKPGKSKAGVQAISVIGFAYLTTITDTSWQIGGTGDFNGDGKVDILWRHYGAGTNALWYMNGSAITGNAYLITITDINWRIEGTGDFNGDGSVDILWRHYGTGHNALWFMNGSTLIGSAYLTRVADTNWQIGGTGDFNGDGSVDILWRHYGTGANALWYVNGSTLTGSAYLTAVTDLNWKIEGVGEFNSDGNIDILWRHYGTGRNALWYMKGTAISGTEYLTTVPVVNWRIENH